MTEFPPNSPAEVGLCAASVAGGRPNARPVAGGPCPPTTSGATRTGVPCASCAQAVAKAAILECRERYDASLDEYQSISAAGTRAQGQVAQMEKSMRCVRPPRLTASLLTLVRAERSYQPRASPLWGDGGSSPQRAAGRVIFREELTAVAPARGERFRWTCGCQRLCSPPKCPIAR